MNLSSLHITQQAINTISSIADLIKSKSENLENSSLSTKEKITIKAASNKITTTILRMSASLPPPPPTTKQQIIELAFEVKSLKVLQSNLKDIEKCCQKIIDLTENIDSESQYTSEHDLDEEETTVQDISRASQQLSFEIAQILSLIDEEISHHDNSLNVTIKTPENPDAIKSIELRITRIEKAIDLERAEELKTKLIDTYNSVTLDIAEKREEAKHSINKIQSDTQKQIAKEKEKLSTRIQEFENLLSVLTGAVISEKYDQYAAEEKKTADWLRYGTIGCLIAGVIATIGIFIESFYVKPGIEAIALRFAIIFSIALPAAYLAKESEKHRKMQHKFRRIDLDLKAIKPYLSSLPDEMQHQIRGEIAHKLFGQSDNEIDRRAFPVDIHELIVELIKNTKASLTPEKKGSN